MKIQSVHFSASCLQPEEYPEARFAEIAFVARSNVGKSSAINTLLNRRQMARVSNTPGKTQRIHFILVNQAFYFVDLPGYGYAKVSKQMRSSWARSIEKYFLTTKDLCAVVMLLDGRHPPSDLDLQMRQWLESIGKFTIFVATKMDKVRRKDFRTFLETHSAELGGKPPVHPFSSKTGDGKDKLWHLIQERLNASREHIPRPSK